MKLNLTQTELKVLNKINRFSYYLMCNEQNGDLENMQEDNLGIFVYNIQAFLDLLKVRGIETTDTSKQIREKLINKNI